jgi:hypothetical protein
VYKQHHSMHDKIYSLKYKHFKIDGVFHKYLKDISVLSKNHSKGLYQGCSLAG